MKKLAIVMLVCIIMFSGCNSYDDQIKSFGTEYSARNKYLALMPDGISIPMKYEDILKIKGESQYNKSDFDLWFHYDLYYDDNFFDKPCKLGLSFENDNLKEFAYIYECDSKNEAEKTVKHIYKYIENCYGGTNNDRLTFGKSDNYFAYANWYDASKCIISLSAEGSKNYNNVKCEISFYDSFAEIETEATHATTTTAYEWKLNTNSTGKDWNSVNDTEKDVWCSNSIAAWQLMGYDIPSKVSVSHMRKTLDNYYQNEDCIGTDLTTASEAYAIASGIY